MLLNFYRAINEKKVYLDGKKLYEHGNIISYSEKKELDDTYYIEAKVRKESGIETVELFLNIKKEFYSTFTCSCIFSYGCKHSLAVILKFLNKHKFERKTNSKYQRYEYEIKDGKLIANYESVIRNWIGGYTKYDANVKMILEEIPSIERNLIYNLVINKGYKINNDIALGLQNLYIKDKKIKIEKSKYKVDIKNNIISIKDISKKNKNNFFLNNENLLSENNKKVEPDFLFERLRNYMEENEIELSETLEEKILYKKETKYIIEFKPHKNKYILVPKIQIQNNIYENINILKVDLSYKQLSESEWEKVDDNEYKEFISFFGGENIFLKEEVFYTGQYFFKKDYFEINKNWEKIGIKDIKLIGDVKVDVNSSGGKIDIQYKIKDQKLKKYELDEISRTGMLTKGKNVYLIRNKEEINIEEQYEDLKENILCRLEKLKQNSSLKFQEDILKEMKIKNQKLNKILRPYQKEGVKWLKFLRELNVSGILADDMGLGKTLQVITLIEELYKKKLILIVVPKSLIYNWADELEKFLKTKDYIIYDGEIRKRREIRKEIKKAGIIITSYGLLKQDLEYLMELQLEYLILDEAQNIKNNKTLGWKAASSIETKYKLALTGTPIENSAKELWTLFEFLMPGYLGKYEKYKSEEGENYLKYKTAPFLLRRTKQEVLKDLPEKTEKIIKINLLKKQQVLYDKIFDQMKAKINKAIKNNERTSYFTIFAALTYLREVCNHPKLIDKDTKASSIKQQVFEELVEEAIEGGHKILVFSQFVKMLEILEKVAIKKKIKYEMLTGKSNKRQERVKRFNENEDIKIFFISLKAGGVGLNLTSADTVIHIDPWWNPMVENQATDRVHRIGQKRNITVYKLITRNTIEEKILQIQKRKKEIFDNIINVKKDVSKKISLDELKRLFD